MRYGGALVESVAILSGVVDRSLLIEKIDYQVANFYFYDVWHFAHGGIYDSSISVKFALN